MEVVMVSESPADTAALQILLSALLDTRIEVIEQARVRAGGWPSVRQAIEVELRHAYYHTDAAALVAIADSDDSLPHDANHDQFDPVTQRCRYCQLQGTIQRCVAGLKPKPGRDVPKIAVATPMPALEAWLLLGTDIHITEARFCRERSEHRNLFDVRRELKMKLYGTASPSLHRETAIALREAKRIAEDLPSLERLFPGSFGAFARQVRSW